MSFTVDCINFLSFNTCKYFFNQSTLITSIGRRSFISTTMNIFEVNPKGTHSR